MSKCVCILYIISVTDNNMEGGKLKHNCVACRKARTKCDRTAPTCRRCKRLGLACVSVAVKTMDSATENAEKTLSSSMKTSDSIQEIQASEKQHIREH